MEITKSGCHICRQEEIDDYAEDIREVFNCVKCNKKTCFKCLNFGVCLNCEEEE